MKLLPGASTLQKTTSLIILSQVGSSHVANKEFKLTFVTALSNIIKGLEHTNHQPTSAGSQFRSERSHPVRSTELAPLLGKAETQRSMQKGPVDDVEYDLAGYKRLLDSRNTDADPLSNRPQKKQIIGVVVGDAQDNSPYVKTAAKVDNTNQSSRLPDLARTSCGPEDKIDNQLECSKAESSHEKTAVVWPEKGGSGDRLRNPEHVREGLREDLLRQSIQSDVPEECVATRNAVFSGTKGNPQSPSLSTGTQDHPEDAGELHGVQSGKSTEEPSRRISVKVLPAQAAEQVEKPVPLGANISKMSYQAKQEPVSSVGVSAAQSLLPPTGKEQVLPQSSMRPIEETHPTLTGVSTSQELFIDRKGRSTHSVLEAFGTTFHQHELSLESTTSQSPSRAPQTGSGGHTSSAPGTANTWSPFAQLDSGSVSTHLSTGTVVKSLKIKLPDEGAGVIGIEAHMSAGSLSATIQVNRQQAIDVLSHELPALHQFVQTNDSVLDQIVIDLNFNDSQSQGSPEGKKQSQEAFRSPTETMELVESQETESAPTQLLSVHV